MRIFISYRRGDAGGHAGRLADDLGERIGAANVFQDVESIAAGDDFMTAIGRAVAAADVVFVVIGPDWAHITDASGTRRLSQPSDVVAMEVAAALASRKRVVPVLVGGATMPAERELPSALAPLARRNAIEVRAATWSGDLDRLLTSVGWSSPGAPPAPPLHAERPRRRGGSVVAAGVIVALAIIALAVRSSSRTTTPNAPGTTTGTSLAAVPDTAISLPPVPRTSLAGPSADPLDVEVTSAAYATDKGQHLVRVALHLRNQGRYDRFVGPKDLVLVVDGASVLPLETLGFGVTGASDTDLMVTFPVAGATARELAVQIHQGDLVADIALTGPRATPPVPPTLRTDGATFETEAAKVTVGPAAVAVLADRFSVTVPIAFENLGAYDANFWDRDFRLVIDGAAQPPVGLLDDIVAAHSTKQAALRWDIPSTAHVLVVRVLVGGQSNEVPLTTA